MKKVDDSYLDKLIKDLVLVLQNLEFFDFIGSERMDKEKILGFDDTLDNHFFETLMLKEDIQYGVNYGYIQEIFTQLLTPILRGVFDREYLKKFIEKNYPGNDLLPINEFEDGNHQTYKYKYDSLLKKYKELEENFHVNRLSFENTERQLAEKQKEVEQLSKYISDFESVSSKIKDNVSVLLNNQIVISDVTAVDENGNAFESAEEFDNSSISERPGVYGGLRPSFFSELKVEYDKSIAAQKSAKNTAPLFHFLVKRTKEMKKSSLDINEKLNAYDVQRKNKILEILSNKNLSNEEKYLKYMLLTPGLGKDYFKTLDGAADLGLSANVVITLLEQPSESFNKEVIESYVSRCHKGTEYNLKQELAEELIRGEWSIRSNINGEVVVYQLAPYEELKKIADKFQDLYDFLSGKKIKSQPADENESENFENPYEMPTPEMFEQLFENELNQTDQLLESEDDDSVEENFDFSGFDKDVV